MSQSDQQSVFEHLLERNRGRFAAIVRSFALVDADDLLQEILLQIWRSLSTFENRSNIDTWCYRIALNTAISWKRTDQNRKTKLPEAASDVEKLVGQTITCDTIGLIHRFLQTLNEPDRATVLMYMEDMSANEIGEVLGSSQEAIRVRIHRIKKRLLDWEQGDI